MEPMKITDKLTLRQEALRMAIMHAEHSYFTEQIIRAAKTYESYLKGSAELPEYSDHDKFYTEILAKMQESFKPKPISMWISADSEMKPAKGVPVICALHYGISNIEYVVMCYNHEEKEWYGGNDDDNTNHVVAWMPILPFDGLNALGFTKRYDSE